MASSKSSQTTRNIVIACLALWSVISLIIIVVWATSPDMKSASQCRTELQSQTEKLKADKVVWDKNKVALEKIVNEGRENQTQQRREIDALLKHLGQINVTRDECRQENVILGGNITVLEKEIEMHKEIDANLTSEIKLQQEHIDSLQGNLTQANHQWESCVALQSVAKSQQLAAENQTKTCESSKLYLQKQLQQCKKDQPAYEAAPVGSAGPRSSMLALAVVCTSLHMITCE